MTEEMTGSQEAAIELVEEGPEEDYDGEEDPKDISVTPGGRTEDMGVEVGYDEVVEIDIGIPRLVGRSTVVVIDRGWGGGGGRSTRSEWGSIWGTSNRRRGHDGRCSMADEERVMWSSGWS